MSASSLHSVYNATRARQNTILHRSQKMFGFLFRSLFTTQQRCVIMIIFVDTKSRLRPPTLSVENLLLVQRIMNTHERVRNIACTSIN